MATIHNGHNQSWVQIQMLQPNLNGKPKAIAALKSKCRRLNLVSFVFVLQSHDNDL